MSRVLVTGASGFVGRHTLAPLAARGFEVHAVARSAGNATGVIWHSLDLLQQSGEALLAEIRPSHLLHSAWITEHGRYWGAPENADWVRVSQDLIEAFARHGGRRVVAVGSCAEYDWTLEGDAPWPETRPRQPATVYGHAKRDLAAWLETADLGLEQAWARLFFLFGDGENPQRIVPYLLQCALKGETARCTSGLQMRDFLSTRLCGQYLAALVASDMTGAVNIASGQGITLRDLVAPIEAATGRTLSADFGALPDRTGDPASIVADVTRLRELGVPLQDLVAELSRIAG